jgi:hypothetical protein
MLFESKTERHGAVTTPAASSPGACRDISFALPNTDLVSSTLPVGSVIFPAALNLKLNRLLAAPVFAKLRSRREKKRANKRAAFYLKRGTLA